MTTIVKRPDGAKRGMGILLSPEAQERARKHLKSVGLDPDKSPQLIWPEDAVSAYREHIYDPWQFITKTDILQRKREKMKNRLWMKREYGVTQRRALYVQVFWRPGFFGFAYRGWWITLVGIDIDFGCKYFQWKDMCQNLLDLFPLIDKPLFGPDWRDWERWKKEFVKKYQRGYWCGKPQGKAPVWAEVQGRYVQRILSRAQWPGTVGRRGE
jgi:hypothetical protein